MLTKHKFRVIFLGTPEIAVKVLKPLLTNQSCEVVAVVTQPDRAKNRAGKFIPNPVATFAKEQKLPVYQPAKISSIFTKIKALQPDCLITCAYGQIIPLTILKLSNYNLNFHASLLPKWRGGAPIAHAIKARDAVTGITIMQMHAQMDAGPFYVQEKIAITPADTTESLTAKLGDLAAKMCKEKITLILNGQIQPVPQNLKNVTYAPNIKTKDSFINWQQSSEMIHAFINAMFSKPIAKTYLQSTQELFKIYQAKKVNHEDLHNAHSQPPGSILAVNKQGIYVKTSDGEILITQLQKAGKKISEGKTCNWLVNDQFH